MADKKISELTQVVAASGLDEFAVSQSGVSNKETLTQIATFRNTSPVFTGIPTAPTAASGTNTTQIATTAFIQSGCNVRVISLSSNEVATSETGGILVSGLLVFPEVGNYIFEYYICGQVSDTTTTFKFSVGHSGGSISACNFYFPNAGTNTTNGFVNQELNQTTGQIWAFNAARSGGIILGPHDSNNAINVNVMYRITGIVNITDSSFFLRLTHGSEVAGLSVQIMAGSSLVLTKVG